MAVEIGKKISLAELKKGKESKKEEEVGFFESALAGVATGLWNIPKGFVSLGAEIFDLIGDTDTARDVDKWFDDVNPFDDEAEARTVGKITQALTQIAPLAVSGAMLGAKAGQQISRSLARKAIDARKVGKSFSLYNAGRKIMGPVSGGVIGGGLGEAVVADEDIGTLADIAKGTSFEPYALTMMDKDQTKEGRADAYRRLKNRLKFGTEGALFNLALVGAGKGVQKLRKPSETGVEEYAESTLGRALQKIRLGLSPQGGGTRQTLEFSQTASGNIGALEFGAGKAVKEFEETLGEVFKPLQNYFMKLNEGLGPKFIGPKAPVITEEKMMNKIFKILSPEGKTGSLLKTEAKERAIKQAKAISNIQSTIRTNTLEKIPAIKNQLDDISKKLIQRPDDTILIQQQKKLTNELKQMQNLAEGAQTAFKQKQGLFKVKDYQLNNELKQIITSLKKAGIKNTKPFEKSILNFRMAIDNMSGKLLQGSSLSKEAAETIESQLGNYLTREYKQYNKLNPLKKWQVTAETRAVSKDKLMNHKIQQFERQQIQKGIIDKNGKALNKPSTAELKRMDDAAEKQIDDFLKTKSIDEVDVTSKDFKNGASEAIAKATKEEIESVKLNSSVLEKRILEPWQEELAGVIKDPRYTFYSTINKQAGLNYTLKYMDDINKTLSVGPNKAIFTKEELVASGLREADINNQLKFKYVTPETGALKGMSALEGKYIQAPMYDAIFDVTSNWLNQSRVGQAYRYMILAPKGVSQIAKTILSPVTHVRNFISASAFAAANGAVLPGLSDIKTLAPTMLGGQGVLGQAYDLTGKRLLGTMTKADNALYQRLRRLSVVDSSVQVGENLRIIKDLRDGETGANIMRKLTDLGGKKGKKAFGKLQDAYVAEDDFWKIVSWNLERNRYDNALSKIGINENNYKSILTEESARGKYFRKMTPRTEIAGESFEGFLDEIAGNMVRNQVPNYNYVGKTARALRQSPFGNFIAFPLEIMRTGNNIMTQAVEEITSGIPELRNIGLRRLGSFGLTVGGIPAGLAATFKAKNNVTDEEMNSLRKFVPEWSKNSTLLPTGRDENGYIKYVDFSYANPYDALTRPFRSIMNSISETQMTEDSLKNALGEGMTEGMMELMQPFISESIFTEALIDSTFRRGIGKGGSRVWSEADDPMMRIGKGVLHVAESLSPGSISQMKRIGQAATGKTDKYGNLYNLQDELPGLAGFRSIQSDPVKSLQFMTTSFGSELKKSENLFTSPLLRGGRVSKKDIINGYKYSESRRFHTLREMYENIEAARSLGVPEYKIREKVKRKGLSKDLLENLFLGVYTPKEPSNFFVDRIGEIHRDLNRKENVELPNPYFEAIGDINKIINKNRRLDLLTEQLDIVDPVEAAAPITPAVNQMSNTNTIVNSQITGTTPVLAAAGTNTNLTQPLKIDDVFKTGIV
tara:strand:+ start:1029 stop:5327 length:4299 start_codon:yes stop_codon:yes gene_type:complete